MGERVRQFAHFLVLYRDIALLAAAGLACAIVAGWSILAEFRRMRRKRIDAVGFMPWTAIFFVATFTACVALGFAARMWVAG